MWKLKLGQGFREFLSAEGRAVRLFGLIVLGLGLILLGGITSRSGEKNAPTEQTAEERVAEICSLMDGVGECRVMMTYTSEGDAVFAVLVLCEGAESVAVRERITSTVTSLYGIGANRVEIQLLGK